MYLSRKDLETHGTTDGCRGCTDIRIYPQPGTRPPGSSIAPHSVACRQRMEAAVRATDPDRWERYLLRRRQEEAAAERESRPGPPSGSGSAPAAEGDDSPVYSDGEDDGGAGLFDSDVEEEAKAEGIGSVRIPGERTGSAPEAEAAPSDLVHMLCRVDMCEVLSPPGVGVEATKFGLKAGDAMDLTTGWDFTRDEDCRKAEEYLDREQPLVLIGSPPLSLIHI